MATLATDRALLLLGVPGTAKSWVSEHLAAAISGDSTLLVQGTAGTARRRSATAGTTPGCSPRDRAPQALVPSPVMVAMRTGAIARIEELTRIPADVQDALITVLSEKTLPVPELGDRGAGASRASTSSPPRTTATRGVNELSSALRRRFNTVVLPLPASEEDEVGDRRQPGRRPGVGPWSCPRCPPRWRRSAGWSRCSASCGPGSPPTAGPRSSRRPARCPPPRRSRWSPAGWRCRPTSATGGCGRPTSRPGSSAPSSRTRWPTRWPGSEYLEVGRPRSARAGRSSTRLPRRLVSVRRGRHRIEPRSRSSASGTTGRVGPLAGARRWTTTSPTRCSSRGRPTPTRCSRWARAEGMEPPVALLAYAPRRARGSPPSGRSRSSPRSGRR